MYLEPRIVIVTNIYIYIIRPMFVNTNYNHVLLMSRYEQLFKLRDHSIYIRPPARILTIH